MVNSSEAELVGWSGYLLVGWGVAGVDPRPPVVFVALKFGNSVQHTQLACPAFADK